MIIPAAGRGTRLSFSGPKLLYPINGQPLLHYLLERYKPFVDRFVVVINPDAESDVRDFLDSSNVDYLIDFQHEATGMLDAITIPMDALDEEGISNVWISWCDQVSITAETASHLSSELESLANSNEVEFMALPTAKVENPYIHMQRDQQGKIVKVLQRREQDDMPEVGENDCGLFAMSSKAYFQGLREFANIDQVLGGETKERNFLPFIAWLNQYAPVNTFPSHSDIETVGINTVDDAQKIIDSWSQT